MDNAPGISYIRPARARPVMMSNAMRLSEYFLPTLKETPAEAQIVSHRLMLRAGMIRQSSAGIYSWLPLGFRVLKKIEQIVEIDPGALDAHPADHRFAQVLADARGVREGLGPGAVGGGRIGGPGAGGRGRGIGRRAQGFEVRLRRVVAGRFEAAPFSGELLARC